MKAFIKSMTVLLALLMLLTCFVACGGAEETETETEGGDAEETVVETETEDPRLAVKDDVPEGLSFANAANNTVTFFTRDDKDLWKYEMDVDELMDDTLWDAIYRRNVEVESRLGVVITTIQQNGTVSKVSAWNQVLRNAVNTKTGDFDATAFYMSQSSALATEGMYYNVVDFPNINLDKPWWNQHIREELTLFDCLYFLAGDLAITQVASGFAIFYNKDFFTKLYPGNEIDLYQMVRDGDWTIDELYDLSANAWEDTNASGSVDDGDVVGFTAGNVTSTNDGGMDAWIAAMGIDLTTMEDGIPALSFYSERTIAAYEKVQALHLDNPAVLTGTKSETGFSNGNVLFMRSMLNTGSSLRDVTFGYGVLPMPKFDADQEAYSTITENTASLISILSSCEADKLEMVGATLELMAAGSYKTVTPAYYEVALKSKYANAPEDAEMYDLILGSYRFSFGYCFSTVSLASMGSLFRNLTLDFAQQYESNKERYETALETLIDRLDEVAFNAQ